MTPAHLTNGVATLEHRHNWLIPGSLLLLAVVVRLPFYFASVIEWDESTFILMGQSLLDGHLPYVDLWDNKPPLLFAFFAAAILMGKSIVTIRIAGTLCVWLTAVLTWRIGERVWGRDAGLIAAACSIVFISLMPSYGDPASPIFGGQATLSEIIALVPVMGALLVLTKGTSSVRWLFLAGVLVSVATLIRTNLAYLVVAVGLVVVVGETKGGLRSLLSRAGAYALGGLLPLSLAFLPYVAIGQARLFATSVFLAPLSYVQAFPVSELSWLLTTAFDKTNVLLWGGSCGGLILIGARWKRLSSQQRYQTTLVGVFLLGIAWSIARSGSAYIHYVVQVVPCMALFAGWFYSTLRRPMSTLPLIILLVIGLSAPTRPLVGAYASAAKKLASNEPLRADAGYRIAAYIATNNPGGEPVYLMTDHIAYWFLGMSPITKSVTHPSTIGKEYLLKVFGGPGATSASEMAALLQRAPLFVVKGADTSYLSGEAARLLADSLETHYALAETIEGRSIYKRVGHTLAGR